jgi:hypothetical protein
MLLPYLPRQRKTVLPQAAYTKSHKKPRRINDAAIASFTLILSFYLRVSNISIPIQVL